MDVQYSMFISHAVCYVYYALIILSCELMSKFRGVSNRVVSEQFQISSQREKDEDFTQ